MKFLLDTDHISILQKQSGLEYAALIGRLTQVRRDDLAFCIVSFHEQVLGCNTYVAQAKTPADVVRGYRMFDRVLSAFAAAAVLPFDANASLVFDGLIGQRLRVATMDLRIASIALSQRLTLLTRNARDFTKVSGLIIEDWTV
ncbi:MAG: type II toxin-antitoxin system VapC family toxin [Planctomycetes bacterium]|nr:type II toxin-antitoxin system VapC family toxin [Planctomycetota bacterium]